MNQAKTVVSQAKTGVNAVAGANIIPASALRVFVYYSSKYPGMACSIHAHNQRTGETAFVESEFEQYKNDTPEIKRVRFNDRIVQPALALLRKHMLDNDWRADDVAIVPPAKPPVTPEWAIINPELYIDLTSQIT